MKSPRFLLLYALGCIVVFAACSSVNRNSTADPTHPVITFPNAYDHRYTTVLESNPYARIAGVDGRTFIISVFNGQQPVADQFSIDYLGNVGIRGTLSSRSSIRDKKDIATYDDTDALRLIDNVRLVSYRYKDEPESWPKHVGFLAEQTPAQLSGRRHDSFNLNNSVGVTMAATKELEAQVIELRKQVAELRSEIQLLRHRQR